jgi:Disulphide bond corrector protein DsbC
VKINPATRTIVSAAIAISAAIFPASMPAQNGAATTQAPASGAKVVTPIAYVSLEQVPRTQTVDVALMLNIASGYHINSHTPSQTYLIPTNITLADTSGFKPAGSNYPDGQMLKFAFTQDKLSVYSGSATIWLRFQAQSDAPLGEITLPLVVKFQACNATACLPPAKVAVPVKVSIATADTKTKPTHPEIFKTEPKLVQESTAVK